MKVYIASISNLRPKHALPEPSPLVLGKVGAFAPSGVYVRQGITYDSFTDLPHPLQGRRPVLQVLRLD